MRNVKQLSQPNIQTGEFDALPRLRRSRVGMRRAIFSDLPETIRFAGDQLPDGIASSITVEKVLAHNRNNILIFEREGTVVGFWAMLMLSPLGLEQILLGEFNSIQPDLDCLVRAGEKPAAIYNWAVVAPRLAVEGVFHVSQFLRQPQFRKANFFSLPNTPKGVEFNLKLGARPIATGTDGLYRYVRVANRKTQLSQAA